MAVTDEEYQMIAKKNHMESKGEDNNEYYEC